MSLKHRGGSKYAKKQMIYAKYDNKVINYLILVTKNDDVYVIHALLERTVPSDWLPHLDFTLPLFNFMSFKWIKTDENQLKPISRCIHYMFNIE